MTYPFVSLDEVVASSTGTANPGKAPLDTFRYVDVAAVDNWQKRIVGTRDVLGSEAPSRARKLISCNDVLVSTIRPNLNAVAIVPATLEGAIASTGFSVLRATQAVLPEFIFYFVRSQRFIESLCKLTAGALYPAVTDRQVVEQRLPLPPLPEQRRIVDILSRAESIVRLRRDAQKKAAELIPALFTDLFGDPATNPKGWPVSSLGSVSEVQGGLQVTKARAALPLDLPYLRVANVHRSRLDLSEIKTIRLTPVELVRIKLLKGDLLLVEGHGNPLEIGRVGIWDGSIDVCVHQNHLIRARCDPTRLNPAYACEYLNSSSGRRFLLRSGKTTSGLTTISVGNVRGVPILLPPISHQLEFDVQVKAVHAIQTQQATATTQAEATFNALLAQVFAAA